MVAGKEPRHLNGQRSLIERFAAGRTIRGTALRVTPNVIRSLCLSPSPPLGQLTLVYWLAFALLPAVELPPPPPRPSNTHVQATLGVRSVNFRTVDFGGALFSWSYCVLCVLSDAWALRYMMFIFRVKEAAWGMMAFVAYVAPRFPE